MKYTTKNPKFQKHLNYLRDKLEELDNLPEDKPWWKQQEILKARIEEFEYQIWYLEDYFRGEEDD